MGLEVIEATITAIHVEPGRRVAAGDVVIEVETDKALTDIPSPHDGFVGAVSVQIGDTVAVGDTLLTIAHSEREVELAEGGGAADTSPPQPAPEADRGADPAPDRSPGPDGAHLAGSAPAPAGLSSASGGRGPASGADAAPASSTAAPNGGGRQRVAPVARRAASRLGVSLATIEGTGPGGRITLRDVEAAAGVGEGVAVPGGAGGRESRPSAGSRQADGAGPRVAPREAGELRPLSPTRRSVARRMSLSAEIPQFTVERRIDVEWLMAEKRRMAAAGVPGLSVNDLLVQAWAETANRHPDLRCAYAEEPDERGRPQLLARESVDVGLAVATERGLLVPVIRDAGRRSLGEMAADRARIVKAARDGELPLAEMSGATVTLSSLSAFGVDRFTALLNPGESAILAVGRVVERVVPRERAIAAVPTLTLTMSLDHRVLDGATGGAAIAELAALLEGDMQWRL